MNLFGVLCIGLGVIALVYFLICMGYAGLSASFTPIWLLVSLVAFGMGFTLRYIEKNEVHISEWISCPAFAIVVIAATAFVYAEALVIYYGNQTAPTDVEYVIVLGARVNGTTITRSLKRRLDTAIEYLEENQKATVIVPGGQGEGEEISEAQAMADYLVAKGIDSNRIIKEARSTNTYENLLYSRDIIQNDDAKVAIVTNGFHIYRATSMAKAQGMTEVYGLSAPTDRILAGSYYTREAIAVIKYKLTGAM